MPEMLERGLFLTGKRLVARQVVEQGGVVGMLLEARGDSLHGLRVVTPAGVRDSREVVLPRRRRERLRPSAADCEYRRPRLDGDRPTACRGIADENECPGRRV